MDVGLVLGGLVVGFVVGLTGMGGGALMTPMLVFFFGVNPLAAVSSDIVTSAVMKPFGGAVHIRQKTVNWDLVRWLALGSVPSAFAGVLLLRAAGGGEDIQEFVKTALGVALLIAASSLILKAYLTMTQRVRRRASGLPRDVAGTGVPQVIVRPLPTVLIGVLGGLVVGMTSVGSGSLIIIALLLVYPALQASQLVGTDLVQAVPLVAAASLGHLLFGDFQLDVATSLIIGSVPGVLLGARASSRAPSGLIRRALALVLLASGLKLVGASIPLTAVLVVAAAALGPLVWMVVRRHHGLPPLAGAEARRRVQEQDRDHAAKGTKGS